MTENPNSIIHVYEYRDSEPLEIAKLPPLDETRYYGLWGGKPSSNGNREVLRRLRQEQKQLKAKLDLLCR